jgi:hypothetical protein
VCWRNEEKKKTKKKEIELLPRKGGNKTGTQMRDAKEKKKMEDWENKAHN